MAGRAEGFSPHEQAFALLLAQKDAVQTDGFAEQCGVLIGTVVLTMDGEIPVEHLTAADRIITRDSGAVTLQDIQATACKTELVRFSAGSLGHRRPDEDTLLPPGQKLLVRDWRAKALYGHATAMVAAARLVDGRFARREARTETRLFHLRFTAPHVIYAGGLELGIEPA